VHISAERIRDELVKILLSHRPSAGIEIMRESNILTAILPELSECAGVKQPELHAFDVYYHSLYSCDHAPADKLVIRLAALLHDIGKPSCVTQTDSSETRFYGHEKKGAEMSQKILERLRFSNREIDDVSHLIQEHMFQYEPAWNDAAVRRFIRRVGQENIPDLIKLRMADQAGMQGRIIDSPLLAQLQGRIESVLVSENALSLKDLEVDGLMLMKELGVKPSPAIGTILDFLLESVLEDPALNSQGKLLEIAKNFYKTRININGVP
ncbi:MAG: HD domain-containing protein, partial [Spirochaetaceae bacterium]